MSYKSLCTALTLICLLVLTGCASSAPISEHYGQRTEGTKVEDSNIEDKISHNLKANDARLGDARINVNAFNGVVLLTGQVPSQELKDMAVQVAEQVRNVRKVHDELTIAANLPSSQRLTDTWITTKVRTALAANESIDSSRLLVVTENATVYLMGIVSRAEADRIVSVVSNAGGMQRIIKVFDYLD
ncbi:BON domain-containing protein [Halomonas elongata]|uniref:BON domain protein n=1 Tax=Halomonas elongata (strain ATCC 33173 / DSM 2581 / NBRC 15536 / NCIMB 2198 / 1H9) TaxID=768066 RepID=E1V9J8_HALED|nr:BON domain-containing protein [Halomonas elongata]MBW5798540.1 BON domain-containing protein [Halomonas elongata]MDL4862448.1 BON domain-containing protein [Halomonas elongata]RAW08159.1 BON domain-containing protein [Halomonas elongata]WBF19077.1 BON domain-containing protein [Halomonas elongata]WPU47936.1 BON domain-containing protein [Halomonas elongata DSM 2581]